MRGLSLLPLLCLGAAQAQGGKDILQWLQEYSPTGYFIIHDYEVRANKPDAHKEWISITTSPVSATAVHEICHMRNGTLSQGNNTGYFIGNGKDYVFPKALTMFNSKEMMPDIPAAMENFQTDVYISGKAGTDGAYSQVGGLYGIFEEFDAYVTEVKSTAEMAACFRAHFNTPKDWKDLSGEITTSIWSNSEFRYFCLRYILWAQKQHPDLYAKILASPEIRECYTRLVMLAEIAIAEWKAALAGQKMDTLTENGFDGYWKYFNELKKPEYTALEAKLLTTPVMISMPPRPLTARLVASARGTGMVFDLLGRQTVPLKGIRQAQLTLERIHLERH